MQDNNHSFKHESLQDVKSIQDILKAITKGLAKGHMTFSDEEGTIELNPDGLLNLKVSAKQEDTTHRLDLKISWKVQEKDLKKKTLNIK